MKKYAATTRSPLSTVLRKTWPLLHFAVILTLLLSGCSRLLPPTDHEKTVSFESRCKPPSIYRGVSVTMLDGPIGESVWRYLTRQGRGKLNGHTYRTELIKSWQQEGRLGESGSDIEHKGSRCFSATEGSMNCKISEPGPRC